MEYNNEQLKAYDKYTKGENIFITGPGGSGKSFLIRKIFKDAIIKNKNIQVCALTGCAAILLNCRAKTLHSWAGIGLANSSIEDMLFKINKNKYLKELWLRIDILVVDEISMLSLKLFDTLNMIGKMIRKNNFPFGGIQLVFAGDFYQLPPVGNRDDILSTMFCFESENWNNVFLLKNQIVLEKIFRQTDDVYSSILNQIRCGKIKKKSNDLLLSYVNRRVENNVVVRPTQLCPTRSKVESINLKEMNLLKSESHVYKLKYQSKLEYHDKFKDIKSKFSQKETEYEWQNLANNIICDKVMYLKVGCQVMCTINITNDDNVIELCNGSQGIVTEFDKITTYPVVKFNNGIEKIMAPHNWLSDKIPGIAVSQIPLILSWALTIHKCQGATLDTAEIDIGGDIFECGQTYVALSRVKNLEGLYLTSYDVSKIKINKKVKKYYDELENST